LNDIGFGFVARETRSGFLLTALSALSISIDRHLEGTEKMEIDKRMNENE